MHTYEMQNNKIKYAEGRREERAERGMDEGLGREDEVGLGEWISGRERRG